MSEHYECPFCGQVRETKKRMDFHLQYGHADLYPLMKRETTSVDLERKLDELREKKTLLEKYRSCRRSSRRRPKIQSRVPLTRFYTLINDGVH